MFNGNGGRNELDRLHVDFDLKLRLLLEESLELFGDGSPADHFFASACDSDRQHRATSDLPTTRHRGD